MNLYECPVLILTTERSYIKRKQWIDIIQSLFKNTKLFYNEDYRDLTDEKKKLYMNIKLYVFFSKEIYV
jgi:hypothetical protein